MIYEVKILGCGGSAGVPDLEKGFGKCDYKNYKNYRSRTSAFVSIRNGVGRDGFKVTSNKSSLERLVTLENIFPTSFSNSMLKEKDIINGSNLSVSNQSNSETISLTRSNSLKEKDEMLGSENQENNLENQSILYSNNKVSNEKKQKDNTKEHNILFDVSPDFRQQSISNKVFKIDSLFFTHGHADHVYGIDDLRSVNRLMQKSIKCYGHEETLAIIQKSFHYIFGGEVADTKNNFYKPALDINPVSYHESIMLDNFIKIDTTEQDHGRMKTMGFVVNNKIGYATDFVKLSHITREKYRNLDLLIVSAFTPNPHISHMHLEEILNLLEYLKPKLTVLTHMGSSMDYESLLKTLPKNVIPAYDGMILSNI